MQNDLISRSALIAEYCDGCDAVANGLCDHDVCGAAQLIMEAPAVDAVEVVRCEKCRYCFDGVCLHPKNRVAVKVPDFGEHYRYMANLKVPKEHFCGYGERRKTDG